MKNITTYVGVDAHKDLCIAMLFRLAWYDVALNGHAPAGLHA